MFSGQFVMIDEAAAFFGSYQKKVLLENISELQKTVTCNSQAEGSARARSPEPTRLFEGTFDAEPGAFRRSDLRREALGAMRERRGDSEAILEMGHSWQ